MLKRYTKTNMFRKIVSNLSFSPAVVGQLSFYAKRLRKEEVTRRLGLVFVALALIVQSLTVFQPSESANAADSNDLVYGGIRPSDGGLSIFLSAYDRNANGLKDIINYFGITRNEIAGSSHGAFQNVASYNDTWYSVNHRQTGTAGEQTLHTATTPPLTFYTRPWHRADNQNPTLWGFKGYSAKLASSTGSGTFYLMDICGNLLIRKLPPPPPPKKCVYNNAILASAEECKPCPGNSGLWVNDKLCVANITQTKRATNTTQGSVDATTATAKESDTIVYTIKVTNTGLISKTVQLRDDLTDTLQYATLIDRGGGTFDETTKVLSWPDVNLSPNESQTRTIAVKILDTIPATAKGVSESTSYDCTITNAFGASVTTIKVPCTPPKVIEKVVDQLPKTGPTENILAGGITLAFVTYFYARSRMMKKEVRLIRRHLNTGGI